MFNLYAIIIALFTVSGLAVAIWSGIKITQSRKTTQWPQTEGVIDKSSLDANGIPDIVFSYQLNGKTYHGRVDTPGASDVTPEISKRFLDQYSAEDNVLVFYDPDKVEHAILNPGPRSDDWFIFVAGLGAMLLGGGFLLTGI